MFLEALWNQATVKDPW